MHILLSLSQRPLQGSTLTPSQVEVKLRDEAGHEDAGLVGQEIVALVALMNWIVSVSSRLTLSSHIGLEIFISLGACWGGEISQVGHQVVLVERPGIVLG